MSYEPETTPSQPGVRAWEAQVLRVGLSLLGHRALVWLATAAAMAIWAIALWRPEPLRLVAAAGYCITVLGPILWRDLKLGRSL